MLIGRCASFSCSLVPAKSYTDARKYSGWNNLHAFFNLLTVILVIVAFVLANIGVGEAEYGSEGDTHHDLGLAVLIIVLITALGGLAAKLFTKYPRFNYVTLNRERPLLRYLHIFLGIASAALLCEFEEECSFVADSVDRRASVYGLRVR